MKSTWSLILLAAVIVGALYFISTTGKKAPAIPGDDVHHAITKQEDCVQCHAPGKQAPLKATHPPKEQCLVCHKTGKR